MSTITLFRRALAEELESTSKEVALQNGYSRERSGDDRRYFAGYAAGLRDAAIAAASFMADDTEE